MALFIGLMSGTSMDAVDTALADFHGDQLRLIAFHQYPLPPDLTSALIATRRRAIDIALEQYGRIHIRIGRLFAEAVEEILRNASITPQQIAAIGSHGQTILHSVKGREPFSLQIGDPNVIAAITGIATVADFRGADIAAGGQGAPLTPAFHESQFRTAARDRVILNIGGIANITILPAHPELPVTGFDTGPGNGLLDDWALRHLGVPIDRDGRWSAQGTVDRDLLAKAKSDPYFTLRPPKSTGRDYFNLDWLDGILKAMHCPPHPQDVQATLLRLTAETIAEAVVRYAPPGSEVLACGGGTGNPVLMSALAQLLGQQPVATTALYGLEPRCIEAVTFAWLAKRRLEGRPGNLPAVTGARKPVVLGAIYAA
ncbi:MAG: anhydro-N-acetylmuramic acid kinase [Chromatiales bacterium]